MSVFVVIAGFPLSGPPRGNALFIIIIVDIVSVLGKLLSSDFSIRDLFARARA